jgi:excisionase family DNA binding protein
VNLELPDSVLDRLADLIVAKLADRLPATPGPSPYMTVEEAAQFIRARSRGRVDDLLSAGRLTRFKAGRNTLVLRAELEAFVRKEQ